MGKGDTPTAGVGDNPHRIFLGGRLAKRAGILISALSVALLALLLSPVAVLAADPDEPDTFQIISVIACRHVYEADDFILVFHYEIYYESGQPDTPASKLFLFRLMDTNGTDQLGSITPYPYQNSGYDQGCSAFYFSADDAPTWEEAYVLRMEGNPQYWVSPPVVTYSLLASDYSQLETQEENRLLLGNYILDVAMDLEINWQTKMVTEVDNGTVLSSTGETYFLGAINGLRVIAPQIFSTQIIPPDYTEREWETTQADAWAIRYDGTWLGDALENLEDTLGIQWNIITGIGILGIIILIFALSQWKFNTTSAAPIPASLILLMGTLMGFVAPIVMALTTLGVVMFSGYILLFRHG